MKISPSSLQAESEHLGGASKGFCMQFAFFFLAFFPFIGWSRGRENPTTLKKRDTKKAKQIQAEFCPPSGLFTLASMDQSKPSKNLKRWVAYFGHSWPTPPSGGEGLDPKTSQPRQPEGGQDTCPAMVWSRHKEKPKRDGHSPR